MLPRLDNAASMRSDELTQRAHWGHWLACADPVSPLSHSTRKASQAWFTRLPQVVLVQDRSQLAVERFVRASQP